MSQSKSWQAGSRPDGSHSSQWRSRRDRSARATDRRFRTAKVIAAISLLVAVSALLIYLGNLFSPPPKPALLRLGDPIYEDLSLPPNAGTTKEEDGGEGHVDLIALASAAHLFAEAGGEQDRNWGRLTADQILSESPNLLGRVCDGLPRSDQGRVAVLYCGLLGLPGADGAKLLVSGQESEGDDNDQAFAAADWLHALDARAQREETRVLVLLDPGSAVASWRRGVLAPEFTAQLRDELQQKKLAHVTVHMAAGPGESSWRITDVLKSPAGAGDGSTADAGETQPTAQSPGPDEVGRSVFSYYVLQGLCGDGTGRGTADSDGNSRITADELFAFVADRVNEWARTRRGVPQTVTMLGAPGDFVVATVEQRVLPPAVRAAVDGAQPVKSSAGAPSGKKPAASKPEEDPVVALNRRLDALWTHLAGVKSSSGGASSDADASTGAGPATPRLRELTPAEWRGLRELLVAAESCLRYGAIETAERHVADAEASLKVLAFESPSPGLPGRSWLRPFLASLPDATPSGPGEKDPARAQAAGDVKAVLSQLVLAPEKTPGLKDSFESRKSVQDAIDWFNEQLRLAKSADHFQKLAAALAAVERAGMSPLSRASPELRLVGRLGAASSNWKGDDEEPLVACAVRLTVNLSRAARVELDDPVSLVAARDPLTDVLRHLAAAERWLARAADFEMANEHLGKAEQALATVEARSRLAGETRRLRAQLAVELPSVAEWLAAERERQPAAGRDEAKERTSRYSALGVLSEALDRIAQEAATGDRVEWHRVAAATRDAWTAAGVPNSEAESALSVLLIAQQSLRDEDAATSKTEALPLDETDLKILHDNRATLIRTGRSEIGRAREDSDWIALERALLLADSPEFIGDRRQVRDALSSAALLQREYVATEGTAAWAPGVWRGFWGRQLVRAAGGRVIETANKEWNALLASAGGADDTEARVARLSFGAALAEQFRSLASADSGAAPRQSVEGARTLILGLFADADHLASGTAEVKQAWNELGVATLEALPDPALVPAAAASEPVAPASVVATSSREAVLPLRPPADQQQLFVKIRRPASGEIFLDERRVEGSILPATAKDPQARIEFDSELVGAATVTVARLDSREFPVEIQQVTVSQQEDLKKWAIHFGIGPDRTLLNDAPNTLRLPPMADAPIELIPLLEFPSSTAESSVTVAVERPNGRGGWETVLGPKSFELTDQEPSVTRDGKRRLPLDFSAAPSAGAAPATTPATPTAGPSFRLDQGVRFLIRVGDEDLSPKEIWPETFGADQYVVDSTSAPRVELIPDPAMPRIEIYVTPERRDDPRLPEAIPVGMYVEPRLANLIPAREPPAPLSLVPLGEDALETRLTAAIDPGKLNEFRALESGDGVVVGLDVGPLSRAMRWRLQRGKVDRIRPDESPIELELVGPPAAGAQTAPPPAATAAEVPGLEPVRYDSVLGAFIVPRDQAKDVRLRYHLFKDRVPSAGTAAGRAWKAILLSRSGGPSEAPSEVSNVSFSRRQDTTMTVNLQGGVWNVSVKSLSHETGLPHTAVGRVQLSAELRRPGAEVVEGSSSELRIAVDNGNPPKPEFSTISQASRERPAKGASVHADRAFTITTLCDDDDSAIRTMGLRIDANNDRLFADTEEILQQPLRPASNFLSRESVDSSWTITPAMLPATGDLSLRVVAIDGRGLKTESDTLAVKLIRPKPKPVPKPKTTGTLIVTVSSPQRVTGPITLTVTGPENVKLEKSQDSARFEFENLKPGDYNVVAKRGRTRKREGTGSTTVKASDEPTTLQVAIE